MTRNTGSVVPAAIEQHEFFGDGQVRHIALEVPASSLPVRWPAERHDTCLTRAQVLHDALDAAVLAGGIPAFEHDQNLVAAANEVALQFDQFDLQMM